MKHPAEIVVEGEGDGGGEGEGGAGGGGGVEGEVGGGGGGAVGGVEGGEDGGGDVVIVVGLWVSNLNNLGVYQYVLSLVSMLVNVWGRLGRLMKLCKGGTLGTFSKFFKNMQRGDPWKKFFLIFF